LAEPTVSRTRTGSARFGWAVVLPRPVYGTIAVAAGIAGVALLAFPGSTPRYFSWPLAPTPAAALVGGFYVASIFTFGAALTRDWAQTRALAVASLGLTIPTFIATLVHHAVFDFSRPQAIAWLLIFGTAPVVFVVMLVVIPSGKTDPARTLPRWAGVAAVVLAVGFAFGAVALWIDPTGWGAWLPFRPPPMTGRFLGAWAVFFFLLSSWIVVRPAAEARIPAVGLTAFGAGAALAGFRTFGQLDFGSRRVAFMVVAIAVMLGGAALTWASNRQMRSGEAPRGLT